MSNQNSSTHRWPAWTSLPASLWSPTSAVSQDALLLSVGAGLCILCILIYFWRKNKVKDELDVPPLEKPAFILALMSVAADRQSRLDIVCSQRNNTLTPLHGVCVEQENKDIIRIHIHDAVVPQAWQGAPVNIFFCITTRSTRTFYHFTSIITNLVEQDRIWIMDVARPTALTHNQRREFVRVTPGAGMVEALTLWPHGLQSPLPEQAQSLGKPDYAFRPPKVAHIALMDISAGGALVRLAAGRLEELNKKHTLGDRYIMLLMLDSLRDGGSLMFWLCGISRRVHIHATSKHCDLGLQFTHWCAPTALSAPIAWQPVETDGEVPTLLRWTGRANVLLSRLAE